MLALRVSNIWDPSLPAAKNCGAKMARRKLP